MSRRKLQTKTPPLGIAVLPLLGGGLLVTRGGGGALSLPHGKADAVVKDQGPYQAQDQLELTVHDVS